MQKYNYYYDASGNPRRVLRETAAAPATVTLADFAAVPDSDCLIYRYACDEQGYPSRRTVNGKTARALRHLLGITDMPEYEVNHHCSNTGCGLHITADTHKVNIDARGPIRERLPEALVKRVELALAAGKAVRPIAMFYRISARQVYKIQAKLRQSEKC